MTAGQFIVVRCAHCGHFPSKHPYVGGRMSIAENGLYYYPERCESYACTCKSYYPRLPTIMLGSAA